VLISVSIFVDRDAVSTKMEKGWYPGPAFLKIQPIFSESFLEFVRHTQSGPSLVLIVIYRIIYCDLVIQAWSQDEVLR
jgi:hypothetical protein